MDPFTGKIRNVWDRWSSVGISFGIVLVLSNKNHVEAMNLYNMHQHGFCSTKPGQDHMVFTIFPPWTFNPKMVFTLFPR